ncbi:MAG TPA: ABC transporter ATP-binding protein [Planctomycetota bacterium]|nr:ABC transporter ATP-binding protein [Planctomycetota bacterium]HRR82119.1 ABC transporter ATP-binding protein [Planctomycetota bacterium]HRT96885.1 ABC transporter ATP-binding protein [Planctomycetota bacterium]
MTNCRDAIIQARGVRRIYRLEGEEVHALRGIDLDIARGEYLSIMGPSGSGKSTLFNMIGGLDRPTAGEILLDGKDIASLTERKLAWLRCNRIGYIFQTFNLLPTLTALENVRLPLVFAGVSPSEADRRAAATLERVGLGHRLHHRPPELSGGQQQRVACARALVNNPAVVLADEPTGNLDLRTGEEILALLRELQRERGATVVCATHDMKMLAASDRVVWIRDGQIERIAHRAELDITVGTMDGQTVA